jgi:bifunctional DNA-binding transcriptional regulator/antitoxin component of YhaV-PrlF toxin-antitoxin module
MPPLRPEKDGLATMTIEIEATLRENNELTIPPEIAERHNLLPGQKLLIVDRMERAGEFIVRVIQPRYAGALAGVCGLTAEESVAYAQRELGAWS